MPTDDERREVAENLRYMGLYGGCRYKEQFYDLLCEAVVDFNGPHEFRDVADRLADLIEPSCDLPALLAIAAWLGGMGPHYVVDRNGGADIARRIREACGDGGES